MQMRPSAYPYSSILRDLVRSTMLAQRELVLNIITGGHSHVDDASLNRFFSWLALAYPSGGRGTNRHLFDPTTGQYPLRTKGLLNRARDEEGQPIRLPEAIRQRLLQRLPPDHETGPEEQAQARHYVQSRPTRISELIRGAFAASIQPTEPSNGGNSGAHSGVGFQIASPLSIIYDYLTVPGVPSTRAYALLALRNLLYEEFELLPDAGDASLHSAAARFDVLTVAAVEHSLSHIWTSMRPRHHSRGQDKLPVGQNADALIRQYLALRGVLHLRFRDAHACEQYLVNGTVRHDRVDGRPAKRSRLEFARSPYLARLPDAGEIANELLGLPLPIRGADTIFRGGLKFSARQGLMLAIHGGPGTGKTTLALALCAGLAPLGIEPIFLTAEENEQDLRNRVVGLVPDDIRRLDFFPDDVGSAITFMRIDRGANPGDDLFGAIEQALRQIATELRRDVPAETPFAIPKPCKAIVVLDGLHDFFAVGATKAGDASRQIHRLYELIAVLKQLRALVIITAGHEWVGDTAIDYLIDVAISLSQVSVADYAAKPDRRLLLSKARHQLCAVGTHGFHMTGPKGVRFSPQISYQLDRRAIWMTRLPDVTLTKGALRRVTDPENLGMKDRRRQRDLFPPSDRFFDSNHGIDIYAGSHILLLGEGSGGKAALAIKIAIAPLTGQNGSTQHRSEKVLLVSFLYPQEYYNTILGRLLGIQRTEFGLSKGALPRLEVIHLYPGHLQPNDLYNRIEWELEAAELQADPYTTVIVDGVHNVFLQFPAIEEYKLFWAQLYSSLRTRPLMTVTTYTTFSVPSAEGVMRLGDDRFEPLRHALVQKIDFHLEVEPYRPTPDTTAADQKVNGAVQESLPDIFIVKVLSAINQKLPTGRLLWSRSALVLGADPESEATK